ncbi:hypothetical protein AO501_29105 [Mycobacterium gordonae]|uniref:PPE family protein n=1 Tax=Mycobacterium gordonae TaxID=1778 RepID=A0A0Q2X4P9_MYCGO|nr:PPE family protein [Mycobacterium gordonae]KQH76284.1 hypothetical protein AO501_29105 [Mycobacterium gordonae]
MDFGALPPEINSGLLYTGPGPAPMLAAASTWNNLAAELATTASSYEAVMAELTESEWRGPASASMAAAVTPYLGWMNATAAAAQYAAAQATAAAAAYETAFAVTVPPPEIAANRALLAALVATNIVGQNTPAIAATEAHYGEMWAQDAAAMYGYAGTAASAATLNPLTTPAPTTNPAGLAGQAAASAEASTAPGLQGLIADLPSALQGLENPFGTGIYGPGLVGHTLDFVNATQDIGIWNGTQTITAQIGSIGAWNMFGGISAGAQLAAASAEPAAATLSSADSAAPSSVPGAVLVGSGTPATPAGPSGLPQTSVLAGMGDAASAGRLSVPASWSTATPAPTTGTLTGAGWTATPEADPTTTTVPTTMPATTGRPGYGFGTPRYGVKPTVMPKPAGVG